MPDAPKAASAHPSPSTRTAPPRERSIGTKKAARDSATRAAERRAPCPCRFPPARATFQAMPKPPRYPLPWWVITDAPCMRMARGSVYRPTLMLALAYWQSGCTASLDLDHTTMAQIARVPAHHVVAVSAEIRACLAAIAPDLQAAWQDRHARYTDRLERIDHMNARRHAKRLRQAVPQETAILTAPRRDPPPPRNPDAPRPTPQAIAVAKARTQAGKEATFHD